MSETTSHSQQPDSSEAPRRGRRAVVASATALAVAAAGVTFALWPRHNHESNNQEGSARALAAKISQELYDPNFPKGVQVPATLNGMIKIDIKSKGIIHTGGYSNPIILEAGAASGHPDAEGKFLNGTWVGIPGSNAAGHVVITPVKVELGANGDTTESVVVDDPNSVVREGVGIYATSATNAGDQLMGFDIQGNGNFPSFAITSRPRA